jgi:hypothetical protein
MKKIIMCALLLFLVAGCKGKDNKNYKEDLISYSSEIKEYNSSSTSFCSFIILIR